MKANVKTEGIGDISINIAKVDKKFAGQLQNLIDATAQRIRTDSIRSIQRSPAVGRQYPSGKQTHIASAAGNPPRTDTGELVRMINSKVGQLEAEVVSKAPYSSHLEFGTVKMRARPFLFPAFEREMVGFKRRLADLVKGISK